MRHCTKPRLGRGEASTISHFTPLRQAPTLGPGRVTPVSWDAAHASCARGGLLLRLQLGRLRVAFGGRPHWLPPRPHRGGNRPGWPPPLFGGWRGFACGPTPLLGTSRAGRCAVCACKAGTRRTRTPWHPHPPPRMRGLPLLAVSAADGEPRAASGVLCVGLPRYRASPLRSLARRRRGRSQRPRSGSACGRRPLLRGSLRTASAR